MKQDPAILVVKKQPCPELDVTKLVLSSSECLSNQLDTSTATKLLQIEHNSKKVLTYGWFSFPLKPSISSTLKTYFKLTLKTTQIHCWDARGNKNSPTGKHHFWPSPVPYTDLNLAATKTSSLDIFHFKYPSLALKEYLNTAK